MARKIGVLETKQNQQDRPNHYVKRVVADYLVRKALAHRITKNLIQLLAVKEFIQCAASQEHPVTVPSVDVLRQIQRKTPERARGLLLHYPIKDQRTLPWASF